MPITKEAIEQRLTELRQQAEVFRQQFNITQGAITDCEFWLKQLVKASSPDGDK